VVRRRVRAAGGGAEAAGLAELGLCVAAALACGRRGRARVEGAGRGGVPAERGAAGPAARRDGPGPGSVGWDDDQRWTLARVTTLIGRLFHVRYTLRGTSYLLHRIGWTPQVPVRRAVERDEAKIAAWRAVTWAKVRG
jgi:Winged helix-turn helix